MIRLMTIAIAASFAWLAGATETSGPLEVGVVVEETRGGSARLRQAARAEVAALAGRGIPAEVRTARSPSEALASAATLVTRGARRLVLISPDPDAVVAPLRRARPGVRLDIRPAQGVSRPR